MPRRAPARQQPVRRFRSPRSRGSSRSGSQAEIWSTHPVRGGHGSKRGSAPTRTPARCRGVRQWLAVRCPQAPAQARSNDRAKGPAAIPARTRVRRGRRLGARAPRRCRQRQESCMIKRGGSCQYQITIQRQRQNPTQVWDLGFGIDKSQIAVAIFRPGRLVADTRRVCDIAGHGHAAYEMPAARRTEPSSTPHA